MDQPKIERMLRLMKMLASNKNYTIDELAERLGISYRSIYRYIDTFKDSGFVVEKLHSNVYRLGKMPKGYVDLKNLIYFSEEEAYIVNSLINSLDSTNALKTNLKKKLSAVYNSTSIIDYVQKKENKVFKISRIGKVKALDEDWTKEDKHSKSKTDCFRISSYEQTPVKLELSMMAKNLLIEEYPLAEQDIRKEGDKWILETMVSGMEGVGRFVIGLAHEIKVIDSPVLENYIRDFVSNYLDKPHIE